jgi:hypothetical protein
MMMGGYLVGGNGYNLPNKFQNFQTANNNTVANTEVTTTTSFGNFDLNDPMAFLKGINSRISNALSPLSINRNELNPNISQTSLDKLNIRLVDPPPQQSIYSHGQYGGMPYPGLQNNYANTTGSMMPMVVQGPNGQQIVGYFMVQPQQQQQTTAMPYGYAAPYNTSGTPYRTGANTYRNQVPQSVWQQTNNIPTAPPTVWQAPVNNGNTPPPPVIVTEANLPNNFQGVTALLEKLKNEPNGSLTQTQRNSISTIVQYEKDINNLKLQTAETSLQAVVDKLSTNTEKLQSNTEKLLQLVEKQSIAESKVTDIEVKLKTNAESLKEFNAQLISNTQDREKNTALLQQENIANKEQLLQLKQELETRKAEIEGKIKEAEIDKVKLESDKTTAEQDANTLSQEKTSLEQAKTTLTQEKTTLTQEKKRHLTN